MKDSGTIAFGLICAVSCVAVGAYAKKSSLTNSGRELSKDTVGDNVLFDEAYIEDYKQKEVVEKEEKQRKKSREEEEMKGEEETWERRFNYEVYENKVGGYSYGGWEGGYGREEEKEDDEIGWSGNGFKKELRKKNPGWTFGKGNLNQYRSKISPLLNERFIPQ
eukprot:TRINITY_DN1310_c0_g1_i1.p1 TRINITY_DN1310_c0_g1~~TRINITY_DN1310_c0_g1_i1.p1  ORF type:complete len:164 (-),score=67.58 TRINITY_DN1310_c0_g1_i1:179-670(-)